MCCDAPLRRTPCPALPCSDAVSIEVLTRQLASEGGSDALLSLCPWLEFVTVPTEVRGCWALSAVEYSPLAPQLVSPP